MTRSFAFAFALVSPMVCAATEPATPDPGDQRIVVTGDAPLKSKQQARAYLGELGVATGERPTARWLSPVCPRAVGLDRSRAPVVEAQLRQTIRSVGAPLAAGGCAGNLLVVFADEGGALIKLLKTRDPSVGADLLPAQLADLARPDLPIRWWYNTEIRSRDGAAATSGSPPGVRIESVSAGSTLPTNGRAMSLYSPSIVSSQVVRAITSAVVIIDVNRASGTRLKAAVDYAALVGLAEIGLGASPSGSILSLFSAHGVHRDVLTARDRRFLSELYKMPMDRTARQQRNSLISAMTSASAPRRSAE